MKQVIENESLLVEVDDLGAQLCRIYDKEKKREVLWEGDPAYWGRTAPILFPNVGRNFGDTYQVGEERYPSSQHGFARDSRFTCVDKTKTEVTHQLVSSEETRKKYPYDFVLCLRHCLEGRTLHIYWEVKNPNRETMYFTIGGHPAFALPREEYEQCQLFFEGKDSLTYLLIDREGKGCVLADQPHTLSLKGHKVALSQLKDKDEVLAEHFFDLDALVFDGNQFETVSILLPDGSEYLKMKAVGFPNFGIWSAPRAPFVCLEPWMGRADDYGYTGLLCEKANINALEKAGVFQKDYSIQIC